MPLVWESEWWSCEQVWSPLNVLKSNTSQLMTFCDHGDKTWTQHDLCAHLLCSMLAASHLTCLSSSQLSWRRLTGLSRPLLESADKFCFLSSLRLTLGQQIITSHMYFAERSISFRLYTYSHSYWDSISKRILAAFFFFCYFASLSTCSKSWFQELGILQHGIHHYWGCHLKILVDTAVSFKLLCSPSLWTWWMSSSVTL